MRSPARRHKVKCYGLMTTVAYDLADLDAPVGGLSPQQPLVEDSELGMRRSGVCCDDDNADTGSESTPQTSHPADSASQTSECSKCGRKDKPHYQPPASLDTCPEKRGVRFPSTVLELLISSGNAQVGDDQCIHVCLL